MPNPITIPETLASDEEYAAAEQSVEDARRKAVSAEQAVPLAEEAAQALRSRLGRGDESVTALDLAAADANIERATILAKACKFQVGQVERRSLIRPVLALIAEPILTDIFGVDVVVVDKMPALPKEMPLVPTLYVRQTKRTERDTMRGIVSGELEVGYMRGRLHVPADWTQADKDAERMGHMIQFLSRAFDKNEAVTMDKAVVEVRALFEETPLLEGTGAGPMYGSALASDVAYRAALAIGHANGTVVPGVRVESVEKDGKHVTTVKAAVEVIPEKGYRLQSPGASRDLARAAKDTVGRAFIGLGRCVSVEVLGGQGGEGRQELTFVAVCEGKAV